MIKCELNKQKNIVSVEVSGGLLEIISETLMIIDAIYDGLKKDDEIPANLLKVAIQEQLTTYPQKGERNV